MTRKFETEKHLKKRHLLRQIPTHTEEKMTVFKGTVEHSKHHQEVVKKPEPTVIVSSTHEVATPTMAIKRETQKEIKHELKNWRDQLIETWHQFSHSVQQVFTSLRNHFKRS